MSKEQSHLYIVLVICASLCFISYFTLPASIEWAKAGQEWGKGMGMSEPMPKTVCKEKK